MVRATLARGWPREENHIKDLLQLRQAVGTGLADAGNLPM